MKSVAMIRILVASGPLAAVALTVAAETPPPVPARDGQGPLVEERDGHRYERPRGDWRGGKSAGGSFGRSPGGRGEAFEKLPEAEKKRVREALEKVWSRPEVMQARDRAMRAHDDFRNAIRVALKSIDPEAAAILERMRPPDRFDPRKLPELPPADSPEFPQAAVRRLGAEFVTSSRPERRDEAQKLHERLIALPEVRQAISSVETAAGEARLDAWQKLREVYRHAMMHETSMHRQEATRPPGPPPEKHAERDGKIQPAAASFDR